MLDLTEYGDGIATTPTDVVKKDGHWQCFVFDKEKEDYVPVGDGFIVFKGRFFTEDYKVWSNDDVERMKTIAHAYNRNSEPICLFVFVKPLS